MPLRVEVLAGPDVHHTFFRKTWLHSPLPKGTDEEELQRISTTSPNLTLSPLWTAVLSIPEFSELGVAHVLGSLTAECGRALLKLFMQAASMAYMIQSGRCAYCDPTMLCSYLMWSISVGPILISMLVALQPPTQVEQSA